MIGYSILSQNPTGRLFVTFLKDGVAALGRTLHRATRSNELERLSAAQLRDMGIPPEAIGRQGMRIPVDASLMNRLMSLR